MLAVEHRPPVRVVNLSRAPRISLSDPAEVDDVNDLAPLIKLKWNLERS
jgi:hypothetical protein